MHFGRGEWGQLLEASRNCDETAANSQDVDDVEMGSDVEKRALRAKLLVQIGELSSARQALEGAALAPGTPGNSGCLE